MRLISVPLGTAALALSLTSGPVTAQTAPPAPEVAPVAQFQVVRRGDGDSTLR